MMGLPRAAMLKAIRLIALKAKNLSGSDQVMTNWRVTKAITTSTAGLKGGDDEVEGRGGDDYLIGEGGNDYLVG